MPHLQDRVVVAAVAAGPARSLPPAGAVPPVSLTSGVGHLGGRDEKNRIKFVCTSLLALRDGLAASLDTWRSWGRGE